MTTPPQTNDTIVALATPPGRGAISIVRLSGPFVSTIASKLCKTLPNPREATLKTLHDSQGRAFEQAIVIYYAAPKSFTGEDMLEIQTHGGNPVVSICLQTCLAAGARLARAGEFSERAFANNKLDLLQAEAIADLIAAGSERAARSAFNAMRGAFSEEVTSLADNLKSVRIEMEALIDFPDEEIPPVTIESWQTRINDVHRNLERLIANARHGIKLNTGIDVAIVGSPNVGKSTLLNHFAREEKAITSNIPGTTRDVVTVEVEYKGLSIRFHDTAGLRHQPADEIEAEGIRRTKDVIEQVDLCLMVYDASEEAPAAPDPLLPSAKAKKITVWNKIDACNIKPRITAAKTKIDCYLSAKTGAGVQELLDFIVETVGLNAEGESPYIARDRHLSNLLRTQELLPADIITDAVDAPELVAEKLRLAQLALSELVGDYTNEDLLGDIFSTFCIGK
ncbi:MAG: tRNA uridine-5-carboxymethylaminomethyl(34) synthesis GTPase MnmE [Gammaproteobacteria bacterium]